LLNRRRRHTVSATDIENLKHVSFRHGSRQSMHSYRRGSEEDREGLYLASKIKLLFDRERGFRWLMGGIMFNSNI